MSRRTYVIADIGACHEGRLDLMQKAVEQAKLTGVDAIKFQWTSDPKAMAARRGKATEDGYADVYARYIAWPREWLEVLLAKCQQQGVDFMCTVFLPQDVAVVAPYVRHFKVASFEADAEDMQEAHVGLAAAHGKWVIVSLGMGAESMSYGGSARFLHCVSSYPAPVDQLNLRRVLHAKYDGLSDHTAPELTWTGALAVAAGAAIVEAHLRLDETAKDNPDGPHAMRTGQFREYVRNIRFAELAMGDGRGGAMPCEDQMLRYKAAP